MTKLASTLMTPEEFEATMVYFPTRKGQSRDIAHAYHVLGQPASVVALNFGCTKQNVVKVLARFTTAYERYNQVRRNLDNADARLQAAEAADEGTPTAAKKAAPAAKKAPAKKAAAKKK